MHAIPAIILSAGASSRMGFPKALLPVKNKTLLEDQIARFGKAGCLPIIAVLGKDAKKIKTHIIEFDLNEFAPSPSPLPRGERVRERVFATNRHWQTGQFSSIAAGLRVLPSVKYGCLILPVDVPFVPVGVVKKILLQARNGANAVVPLHVPTGRKGHPVWISEKIIGKILKTDIRRGRLDKILQKERKIFFIKTSSSAILGNMNTQTDWKTTYPAKTVQARPVRPLSGKDRSSECR